MLKSPDHQVAGHKARNGKLGPLVDDAGRFYKPLQGDERGSAELSFYNSIHQIPTTISKFFPAYHGTQILQASDGSGLRPHLVLDDLLANRVNPSVIDIKIGSRTWYPQASDTYIEKCVKKDRETSSLILGFRISGIQIYQTPELGFWKAGKRTAQKSDADGVRLLLSKFVSSNSGSEEADSSLASPVYGGSSGILSQLMELKCWFENQTDFHFYSCSVLIFFEKEALMEGRDAGAGVKLVDFAHVVEGGGVIDHNFLGGLCSLIKFVSEICPSSG